ncbi:hypothetical protein SISSUDRAFT_93397 [Sistotremastrum suecicum HHB10207 ss-3]|uniref:Uncharacterized protein n=1 Tax=Sistotremastrum suecicum HHB10207 ss-3 TaxID=1314776 RepID=A0A166B9T4_9AGAM|nr:hypothetical protein SISSUDRAFT_93397 [Sistotremastrum suecicum HHB10207 ss-3]
MRHNYRLHNDKVNIDRHPIPNISPQPKPLSEPKIMRMTCMRRARTGYRVSSDYGDEEVEETMPHNNTRAAHNPASNPTTCPTLPSPSPTAAPTTGPNVA